MFDPPSMLLHHSVLPFLAPLFLARRREDAWSDSSQETLATVRRTPALWILVGLIHQVAPAEASLPRGVYWTLTAAALLTGSSGGARIQRWLLRRGGCYWNWEVSAYAFVTVGFVCTYLRGAGGGAGDSAAFHWMTMLFVLEGLLSAMLDTYTEPRAPRRLSEWVPNRIPVALYAIEMLLGEYHQGKVLLCLVVALLRMGGRLWPGVFGLGSTPEHGWQVPLRMRPLWPRPLTPWKALLDTGALRVERLAALSSALRRADTADLECLLAKVAAEHPMTHASAVASLLGELLELVDEGAMTADEATPIVHVFLSPAATESIGFCDMVSVLFARERSEASIGLLLVALQHETHRWIATTREALQWAALHTEGDALLHQLAALWPPATWDAEPFPSRGPSVYIANAICAVATDWRIATEKRRLAVRRLVDLAKSIRVPVASAPTPTPDQRPEEEPALHTARFRRSLIQHCGRYGTEDAYIYDNQLLWLLFTEVPSYSREERLSAVLHRMRDLGQCRKNVLASSLRQRSTADGRTDTRRWKRALRRMPGVLRQLVRLLPPVAAEEDVSADLVALLDESPTAECIHILVQGYPYPPPYRISSSSSSSSSVGTTVAVLQRYLRRPDVVAFYLGGGGMHAVMELLRTAAANRTAWLDGKGGDGGGRRPGGRGGEEEDVVHLRLLCLLFGPASEPPRRYLTWRNLLRRKILPRLPTALVQLKVHAFLFG